LIFDFKKFHPNRGYPLKKIILLALCCILFPFTGYAKKDNLTIGLEYKPRDNVKVHPKNVPPGKIFFEPIQDARANSKIIGENLEDKKDKVIIRSSIEPSNFVRSVLVKEFRNKKFSVEDNAAAASKLISGTLVKFWTVETSSYDSQTQIRFDVKDRTGNVLFSRAYTGVGKNRGRSLNDTNYEESIGNSMTALIDKVFSDSEFLTALSERSSPPPPDVKTSVSPVETPPARTRRTKKSHPSAPSTAPPVFGPK
jgi:hypothetical protein